MAFISNYCDFNPMTVKPNTELLARNAEAASGEMQLHREAHYLQMIIKLGTVKACSFL
jgi:hypothetical protein